jgi:hypothetical protein
MPQSVQNAGSRVRALVEDNGAILAGLVLGVAFVWAAGFSRDTANWLAREPIKDSIAAAGQLVSAVATILGAAWIIQRFVLAREAAWNVQVTVKPRVLPYDSDHVVLVVNVYLKNVGRTAFRACREGIDLTVYQVRGDVKAWGWASSKVIEEKSIDMLRYYDTSKYLLEPNCKYHEVEAIVVPKDILVCVLVTLHGQGETIDEEVIVRTSV